MASIAIFFAGVVEPADCVAVLWLVSDLAEPVVGPCARGFGVEKNQHLGVRISLSFVGSVAAALQQIRWLLICFAASIKKCCSGSLVGL